MYDFEQYLTYNDIERSDNIIFTKQSFESSDGIEVPITFGDLVNWTDCTVIGLAKLENRDDGVYAYCTFYNNDLANKIKSMLIDSKELVMSFRAYKVSYKNDNDKRVVSGIIRVLVPIPTNLAFTYQMKLG